MICCRLRRLPLTRLRKRGLRRYAELHTISYAMPFPDETKSNVLS
jgi:hypothetical protein